MDSKVKVAWQALLLVRESNACCSHSKKHLKNEKSKDQKDSEAKKNYSSTNNNSGNTNRDQSDQALNWFSKKDFRSNRGDQQSQSSNIPTTSVNAIVIKKNKKQGNRNLSQIKCYTCHKKDHYTNKCPDKKLNNKC